MLFTSITRATPSAVAIDTWDNAQIVVQSLKSRERRTVLSGASDARYVPSGYLVYAVQGTVFAVPFDRQRLAATGGPVPVIEGVRRATTENPSAVTQFHVSNTGTLAYIPGPLSASASRLSLGLFDRSGGFEPFKIPPGLSGRAGRVFCTTDSDRARLVRRAEGQGDSFASLSFAKDPFTLPNRHRSRCGDRAPRQTRREYVRSIRRTRPRDLRDPRPQSSRGCSE